MARSVVKQPVRRFLSSGLVVVCAGCASVPPPTPAPAPAPQPIGAPARPFSGGLDEETLFKLLVAEIAGQRGRIDVALDHYMELAARLDDPQVAARATRIAVFARDSARALAAAERWVALAPEDTEARQILAAMKIRTGDVDGALEHLRYILDASAGDAGQRLRMIASFLSREQDQDTALAVMQRLVAERDGDADALHAYALLAIRTDNPDRARTALDRLRELGALETGVAVAYLGLLQKRERVDEAIGWLEGLLEERTEDLELRLVYARLLADAKRYDESRAQFEILAEQAPDNGDIQYALALLYLQANRLDDAAQRFVALVESGQRVDEGAYYLGQIAEAQDRPQDALAWYRRIEGGPNRFEAQLRVAVILARAGRTEAALAHLEGLEAPTRDEEVRRLRVQGEILVEAGRDGEAMALYTEALEHGYHTDLLYTRAMLAERMDRLDLLEADLRAILEREPDNAQALNALGYTLADRTDRYEEAYELIRRALELAPEDYYILDSMGWVLYRLGRLDEAVDYLRRARAIRDDPEVAAHLAEVLWVLGDKQGAREVWESALRMAPNHETLLETIERLAP